MPSASYSEMDLQFLYSGGGSLHGGTAYASDHQSAMVNELGGFPYGACAAGAHTCMVRVCVCTQVQTEWPPLRESVCLLGQWGFCFQGVPGLRRGSIC